MNENGLLEWTDIGRGLLTLVAKTGPIFRLGKNLLTQKRDKRLSLGAMLAQMARRYPDHAAIKYEGGSVTYRELDAWSNRLAHYFLGAGLPRGGVVALLMENRPALLAVATAVAKAGGVTAMLNTKQRKKVLVHSLRCCEPVFYAVGEELVDAIEEIRGELGDNAPEQLYFVKDSGESPVPEGYIDIDRAARLAPDHCPAICDEITLGDPCFYIFTSGTTGLPKASIMSHDRWVKAGYTFGGMCLELAPGDTLYAPLPLYHNQALTLSWSSACVTGAALGIRRKFSVSAFWDDCRNYGASAFVYIGEIPRYLMNQKPGPGDRNHGVRKIVGVGLRPDIWQIFKDRFAIKKVYELYGASEFNVAFVNVLNLDCTVGICPLRWALVSFDVSAGTPIRDQRGRLVRVGKGEVGLLIAKVGKRFKFDGYTDAKESESKLFRDAFEDGDVWVNSGDLMRNIGFGHLQFVDRVGDTFRWKSENVSTGEVESIINALDSVAESSVYGVEIPGAAGRAGMVTLVLAEGVKEFALDQMLAHMLAELPSYAVPIFVRVTDSLVVTGTFKHRKVELREQGYDPGVSDDPMYVLLPRQPAYRRLTREVHARIRSGDYSF
ncbi:MAG: long-chain-acyl-CoA synthetase [Proteobacteria bacterium]|nr:long-chain-acyl-CoA synthetase [Pseudomonadota bacterium]